MSDKVKIEPMQERDFAEAVGLVSVTIGDGDAWESMDLDFASHKAVLDTGREHNVWRVCQYLEMINS
jgi:hypothetical protein